jgi:hypothetical protein
MRSLEANVRSLRSVFGERKRSSEGRLSAAAAAGSVRASPQPEGAAGRSWTAWWSGPEPEAGSGGGLLAEEGWGEDPHAIPAEDDGRPWPHAVELRASCPALGGGGEAAWAAAPEGLRRRALAALAVELRQALCSLSSSVRFDQLSVLPPTTKSPSTPMISERPAKGGQGTSGPEAAEKAGAEGGAALCFVVRLRDTADSGPMAATGAQLRDRLLAAAAAADRPGSRMAGHVRSFRVVGARSA